MVLIYFFRVFKMDHFCKIYKIENFFSDEQISR
jgi:hypothetical protein